MIKDITKTRMVRGTYTSSHGPIWEARDAEPIYQCICTRRYLKTRKQQDSCLECMTGLPVYRSVK